MTVVVTSVGFCYTERLEITEIKNGIKNCSYIHRIPVFIPECM